MSFIADLHVHSRLSRATSRECCLEGLHRWAQLKGVRVVGTGDFTHPEWSAELRAKLEPSAPGLFRLRADAASPLDREIPESCRAPVHFILSGEVSSIYKRDRRTRKVHSLLLAPDFAAAERINARLDRLGNIRSDGRPILGLDPRDLLQIALDASPDCCLIPAHIWTPWFSMLGSNSGFDSPRECFGDLLEHVYAVETGLSSDPPMNWRVSSLDGLCLVSNSDLHSPSNLGRNANVFHVEPDYFAMRDALRDRDPRRFGGTIDLFPEEGKYHCDGHRKCGVCLEPEESLALDGLCPACGKPLVLGVLHRVVELADRPKGARPAGAMPCEYIIPLAELLSEIIGCGVGSRRVTDAYHRIIARLGPEFAVLRETKPAALDGVEPALLGEAVRRVRARQVIRRAGYDGEYGVIRAFADGERNRLLNPGGLFAASEAGQPPARGRTGSARKRPAARRPRRADGEAPAAAPAQTCTPAVVREAAASYGRRRSRRRLRRRTSPRRVDQLVLFGSLDSLSGLTPEQREAAATLDAPVLIVAGPGTGKTRTLTGRIAHLVLERGVDPEAVLAITFTNRAANEMRERMARLLPPKARGVRIATFHAFCLDLLRRFSPESGLPERFQLIDAEEEIALLRTGCGLSARDARRTVEALAAHRRELREPDAEPAYTALARAEAERGLVSLDDLVPRAVRLLRAEPSVLDRLGFAWICVDEYQDVDCAQYELVRLLARDGKGLCAIGDPDQAIYGFRGADVRYFLRFREDFPAAQIRSLSRNFRSTAPIVAASGQVISAGRTNLSVAAESVLDAGLRVRFHESPTAAAEAEFVTHETEKWLGGASFFSMDSRRVGDEAAEDVSLADVAVLVRLRVLLHPFAEALGRLGLPVQIVGEEPFMDHPGVRPVMTALSGLPRKTLDETAAVALEAAAGDSAFLGRLDGEGREALEECRRLAASERAAAGPPTALRDWLDRIRLRQGADRYDARAERVTLMTLHAAKGLEFPVVFLCACEDGILPYRRDGIETAVEEERRLLYVGMTRAQRVLYVTSARKRTLLGRTEPRAISPFVREIEAAVREDVGSPVQRRRPPARQCEFGFV